MHNEYIHFSYLINFKCIRKCLSKTFSLCTKVISYFSHRKGRKGVSVISEKRVYQGQDGGSSNKMATKVSRGGKSEIGSSSIYQHSGDDELIFLSQLLIRDATATIDDGKYTCAPSSDGNLEGASTRVSVLKGWTK